MKVSDYRKLGLNCAESVISAYNEDHGTSIPMSIASGMGGGFSSGSLCGAIAASVLVIGFVKGRDNADGSNEASAYTRIFMDKIQEKYGTNICRELKAKGVTCMEIEDFAYEVLNTVI